MLNDRRCLKDSALWKALSIEFQTLGSISAVITKYSFKDLL
jgi:hypothetical protein